MVGIDVADVKRVREILARYPRAEERLFSRTERTYCRSFPDPVTHFAGTFAAKEAVIKALQLGPVLLWAKRIEIVRDSDGGPFARVTDNPIKEKVAVSISHDADVAVAVAVFPPPVASAAIPVPSRKLLTTTVDLAKKPIHSRPGIGNELQPNPNVRRFLGRTQGNRVLVDGSQCVCGSDFP